MTGGHSGGGIIMGMAKHRGMCWTKRCRLEQGGSEGMSE